MDDGGIHVIDGLRRTAQEDQNVNKNIGSVAGLRHKKTLHIVAFTF